MKKYLSLFLCLSAIGYAIVNKDLTRIQFAIPNDKDNRTQTINHPAATLTIPTSNEDLRVPGRQGVIGYTTYDWQYNGPVYSHCRVDPINGIHCYWMYSNFNPATDRNQRYNFYDFSTRTWNWTEGVQSFPIRSGFGGMDIDPLTGCYVASTHQTIGGVLTPVVARDQAPGAGLEEYCQGPSGYQGPAIAVSNNQAIHIAMTGDSLLYSRIQPWCNWTPPVGIAAPGFSSYNIAASKTTNKVIIVWQASNDIGQKRAFYRLSTDGGVTWGPQVQIPFPPSQGLVPSFHTSSLFAMFDNQDNFHIVTSVSDTGHTIPAEIWHWCPINPQPWTLIHHYDAETLNAGVGYNAIFATRPSIIQDPTTLYFYVTWEVFDSLNYEPTTFLARADIWVAELRNNGQFVSFRARLTSPNTTSKRFPCIGGIINTPSAVDYDTLVIMYLIDSIAGFENYSQGRATRNPVVVHFAPQRWMSIEEESKISKFYDLVLFAPSPNPFSSHTAIRYSLPTQSSVSLSIYDVTGRLIKVLVSDTKPIGEHSVTWNGQDNQGNRVKNGIYFCSLKTNGKTVTRKIILSR
jgi:hypothetical protein